MTITDFYNQSKLLSETPLMPTLFVGHGSPMNAIEDNEFVEEWVKLKEELPHPKAILCISAHWETKGTQVTSVEYPKTIHDFYGFPKELYTEQYPAKGSPALAEDIKSNVQSTAIGFDYDWGLDHGTWSILKYFYPGADIPVIQLSIDYTKGMQYHYDLARELSYLRKKGVLIIGSGNLIHNLRMIQLKNSDFNTEFGYDWAFELSDLIKRKVGEKDHKSLVNYTSLGKAVQLAVPTPEHYIPLLYILGLQEGTESMVAFNDKIIAGSLSMTSFMTV